MGNPNESNGKNSLVGEFLLSLARAPEPVQEAIIIHGLRKMVPYARELIQPYPMLSHMMGLLNMAASESNDPPKK